MTGVLDQASVVAPTPTRAGRGFVPDDCAKSRQNAEGSSVPTVDPYTNAYVKEALDLSKADGADVTGESYAPMEVTLEEGGK